MIQQELENANITWRQWNVTKELGAVDEKEVEIPQQRIETAKMALEEIIQADIKTGSRYTLWNLCNKLRPDAPPHVPLISEGGAEELVEEEADEPV